MKRLDADVLEALGLSGDAVVTEIESAPAPPSTTGLGFSLADELSIHEITARPTEFLPALTPLDLPRLTELVPEATVASSDLDPERLVVQVAHGDIIGGAGASPLDEGAILLDSRSGKAYARIRGSRGEVVIAARKGAVFVFAVESALSPELDALSRRKVEPPVAIDAPSLRDLLGDLPAPGWMAEAHARLAGAPSAFARAAAAGLVGRLWSPPGELPRDERRRLLERVAQGEGPASHVQRWVEALSGDAREQIAEAAIGRADRLRGELDSLAVQIAADPAAARPLALAYLFARDDLESVASIIQRVARVPALDDAIDALDREVSIHHTMWSALEAFDSDPRLGAVAWQEPLAWWGQLAHAD